MTIAKSDRTSLDAFNYKFVSFLIGNKKKSKSIDNMRSFNRLETTNKTPNKLCSLCSRHRLIQNGIEERKRNSLDAKPLDIECDHFDWLRFQLNCVYHKRTKNLSPLSASNATHGVILFRYQSFDRLKKYAADYDYCNAIYRSKIQKMIKERKNLGEWKRRRDNHNI